MSVSPRSSHVAELESVVHLQGPLGYLNFSAGKPDARFQKQIADAYAFLAFRGVTRPWDELHVILKIRLHDLKAGGASAFQDISQAEAVLDLAFERVLSAYRKFHADLLAHVSDQELFQPFFLVRVCEAILGHGGPWNDEERIVSGALSQLNDFTGYRPVAILETRPKGEPYVHERVRPIPLYIRGVGVAGGRYHDLIAKTLEILKNSDPALLDEAALNLELLDELALDPRAYDHGHPVNRRPNYVFGEWDPHHLDDQGRYRRLVIRQVVLDALSDRVARQSSTTLQAGLAGLVQEGEASASEALTEAAAVLAGTMIMAAAASGDSPTSYDSSVTLATLVPRIAGYRDAFYAGLLKKLTGPQGERLREEAKKTRQPFGSARQHLNQHLARQRALQLQQRRLSLIFAKMGYPEASRFQAAKIATPSVRVLGEILSRMASGKALIEGGKHSDAAKLVPEIEDLLLRGISIGAVVDPWNILGFQGQFPLTAAREDSVHDPRVDELLQIVDEILNFYGRLLSEAAAGGEDELIRSVTQDMRRFAEWWDQFASFEVSGFRRVHGDEIADAAEHVASAMRHWRQRGETPADLAFWRERIEGFTTPKAFAQVIEMLLAKQDFVAAQGLLMQWLSQAEQIPLEDEHHAFHALAEQWLLRVIALTEKKETRVSEPRVAESQARTFEVPSVAKFFGYLETNAGDFWRIPEWNPAKMDAENDAEEDDLYKAAYDDVTFRDSADDDVEGAVMDDRPPDGDFSLEYEADDLLHGVRFIAGVARLWRIAARHTLYSNSDLVPKDALAGWLTAAEDNLQALLNLQEAIHALAIPDPSGSHDSFVEYDRRRMMKEHLLQATIACGVELQSAADSLRGCLPTAGTAKGISGRFKNAWSPLLVAIERALAQGDAEESRKTLPKLIDRFKKHPLLYAPLDAGGNPAQILRVRTAQTVLRRLMGDLPRRGLLREAHQLLQTARAMEQVEPPEGKRVSEFDHLFHAAYRSVVETVIESAGSWSVPEPARTLTQILEAVAKPFFMLWIDYSRTLRLSPLEAISADAEWQSLQKFVQSYGRSLFTARFMILGNLRGILHRGVGAFLDHLEENPDPLHPVRLAEDLGRGLRREEAIRWLQLIIETIVENYEEYKDYNTSTTQSDYADQLYMLLDFLRLKANYLRHAWHFRPLMLVHELLARHSRWDAAALWERGFAQFTHEPADAHFQELVRLEQKHGMKLRTVSGRIEERFVAPLKWDHICALAKPAMEEAKADRGREAWARLQVEINALAQAPSGAGLDEPGWVRRLEVEVEQIRQSLSRDGFEVDPLRARPATLSLKDIEHQLQNWNNTPDGSQT